MEKQRYFKYTMKSYADDMLKYGRVRIGTLYEYRHYDNEEIKDSEEGKSNSHFYIKDLTIKSFDDMPDVVRHAIKVKHDFFEKGGIMDIKDVWFFNNINVPNFYIYCLTKEFSTDTMEHFGYDSCIEITDIEYFKRAIGFQLLIRGLLSGMKLENKDCLYVGRKYQRDLYDEYDTYWFKDERFKHQFEHRLIFPTKLIDFHDDKNHNLQPLLIDVPDIRKSIRLYK